MKAWKADGCSGKSVEEILASAVSLTPTSGLRPPASGLRVVASRSHCNDETRGFIADLEQKYGEVELVSSGSSLKLCMVADGSADIYPRIAPTMEWDTAAAHAVVKAAGGEVVKYDPAIPAVSYLCGKLDVGRRKCDVESEKPDVGSGQSEAGSGQSDHPTSHLQPSTNTLRALRYNKENLLNPYFVVSGLHE